VPERFDGLASKRECFAHRWLVKCAGAPGSSFSSFHVLVSRRPTRLCMPGAAKTLFPAVSICPSSKLPPKLKLQSLILPGHRQLIKDRIIKRWERQRAWFAAGPASIEMMGQAQSGDRQHRSQLLLLRPHNNSSTKT
jgi:hypothetical protein